MPFNGKITVYTQKTGLPSEALLEKHARIYMDGFNSAPWDIYGWNMSPEKAKREFSKLVSVVLKTGGVLLSLENEGIAAGFCISTGMSIFIKRQEQVLQFKRLPKDYINPEKYLIKLRNKIGINVSGWHKVGYLADLIIDSKLRGHNYGKTLVEGSLEYLKNKNMRFALGWSVNPVMSHILKSAGFKRIPEIGDGGEGIDFLLQGRVWYPTLDIPIQNKSKIEIKHLEAEHYIKRLLLSKE